MTIWLVRHGETQWNIKNLIQGQTDIALNTTGKEQATLLANRILSQKLPISRIYSSKLIRASQTAAILSEIIGIPYVIAEGLEEMNLGTWEGKTWKEVRSDYSDEFQQWNADRRNNRPPQGESYQDLLDRLLPVLNTIVHSEQADVLIVTHSACIMTLFSYMNHTPFEDMVKNYRTGNGEICKVTPQMLAAGRNGDD